MELSMKQPMGLCMALAKERLMELSMKLSTKQPMGLSRELPMQMPDVPLIKPSREWPMQLWMDGTPIGTVNGTFNTMANRTVN